MCAVRPMNESKFFFLCCGGVRGHSSDASPHTWGDATCAYHKRHIDAFERGALQGRQECVDHGVVDGSALAVVKCIRVQLHTRRMEGRVLVLLGGEEEHVLEMLQACWRTHARAWRGAEAFGVHCTHQAARSCGTTRRQTDRPTEHPSGTAAYPQDVRRRAWSDPPANPTPDAQHLRQADRLVPLLEHPDAGVQERVVAVQVAAVRRGQADLQARGRVLAQGKSVGATHAPMCTASAGRAESVRAPPQRAR